MISFSAVASTAGPGALIMVGATNQSQIQRAVQALPPAGGTVVVIQAAGPIVISESIVIDRDNVTLAGQGVVELRLADGANKPVLVLGQTQAVPTVTRTNIHIRDLIINGNRTRQSLECDPANPELRNNGISLRRVEDCTIERVKALACRSGGLVTELSCRRVTIRQFEAYDNHFDGLACYQTWNSVFEALNLHDNLAAGMSLDIDFESNVIRDSVLTANGSVGIFMRDSRYNLFNNLRVHRSADHGIFLAQVDTDPRTSARANIFRDCVITNSGGAGIRLNDPSCVNNQVYASTFTDNGGGDISEAVPGLFRLFP